jgi:hypothetical protein
LASTKRIAMLIPKSLLHLESAAVLIAACTLYYQSRAGWLWFGLLFITPDLSMLGYLRNKRLGAAFYNSVLTYTAPILACSILWFSGQIAWVMLIWLAHIGLDRMSTAESQPGSAHSAQ